MNALGVALILPAAVERAGAGSVGSALVERIHPDARMGLPSEGVIA